MGPTKIYLDKTWVTTRLRKFNRPGFLAALSLVLLIVTTPAQAVVITQDLLFNTTNQNMWAPGAPGVIHKEVFAGLEWGSYNPSYECGFQSPCPPETFAFGGFTGGVSNNVCIGVNTSFGCAGFRADIDTTTGAELKLETSGKVGINIGANLFGGSVDIKVPVQATLEVPDQITAGQFFTLSTSTATQSTGAKITTTAPSAEMYIDGVFDTKNTFYGEVCAVGACYGDIDTPAFTANFTPGPFPIIAFKTQDNPLSVFGFTIPNIPFDSVASYPIYDLAAPLACYDKLTDPNPFCPIKPTQLATVKLEALQDNPGVDTTLAGNDLALLTDQHVLDFNLSLTGVVESLIKSAFAPGFTAGLLKNSLTLVDGPGSLDVKVSYTIIDVTVGPFLGLQQQFDLAVKPAVELQFDRPVERMESVQIGTQQVQVGVTSVCSYALVWPLVHCHDEPVFQTVPVFGLRPVTHADGKIEIVLGQDADLRFSDGVGQLLSYEFLLRDPMFSNSTSLTTGVAGGYKLGCLSIPGVANGCVAEDSKDFLNDPFLSLWDKQWAIGGFNSIAGTRVAQFNAPDLVPEQPSVPEPGTLFLILVGIFGIAFSARRHPRCRIIQVKAFI